MGKNTPKNKTLSATDLSACTTVAVDLAKNVFQVAGEDQLAHVVYEQRIKSRAAFITFLHQLPLGITVLMETGPGAQSWARLLQDQGQQPRILPAQHVANHRSGPKNDRNDVLAILRAGRDSNIHAVPVKSAAGLEMQALHRVRRRYVKEHTAIGNQMRGLLLEHGFSIAQGKASISRSIPELLADSSKPLPPLLHELISEVFGEWLKLAERIEVMTGRLDRSAREDSTSKRLMTIRGVGPILSTSHAGQANGARTLRECS